VGKSSARWVPETEAEYAARLERERANELARSGASEGDQSQPADERSDEGEGSPQDRKVTSG
jgi:hypothetical protein